MCSENRLVRDVFKDKSVLEVIVEADLPECSPSKLNLDTRVQLLANLLKSQEVLAHSKLGSGDCTVPEHKMNTLKTMRVKEITQRTHLSLVDGDEAHGEEGIVCPLYLTKNSMGSFRRTWDPRGLPPQDQELKDASIEICTSAAEERLIGCMVEIPREVEFLDPFDVFACDLQLIGRNGFTALAFDTTWTVPRPIVVGCLRLPTPYQADACALPTTGWLRLCLPGY
jgi:hypothetical protein